MTVKINGDFQTQPGDLLNTPRAQRQWHDIHANPGRATIIRSDDPQVPAGCPTPLVARFEAAPYAQLGNRLRADAGQAHGALTLDGSHGMRRYLVGCSWVPAIDATANLITQDYHSNVLGTHAHRHNQGRVEQTILAGARMYLGAVSDPHREPAPKGWWLYGDGTDDYAFQAHAALDLGAQEDVAGRWVVWGAYWRWFGDGRGGVTVWRDGDMVADWAGPTVAFDAVTGALDGHYAKVGAYLPAGGAPVVTWHTGWQVVTRWREARALMRALASTVERA
jgi:hypothetical protein